MPGRPQGSLTPQQGIGEEHAAQASRVLTVAAGHQALLLRSLSQFASVQENSPATGAMDGRAQLPPTHATSLIADGRPLCGDLHCVEYVQQRPCLNRSIQSGLRASRLRPPMGWKVLSIRRCHLMTLRRLGTGWLSKDGRCSVPLSLDRLPMNGKTRMQRRQCSQPAWSTPLRRQ